MNRRKGIKMEAPNKTADNRGAFAAILSVALFAASLLVGLGLWFSYSQGHRAGYKVGKKEASQKYTKDMQKHLKELDAIKKSLKYFR